MIILKNINNILNLVGKYIRHDTTNRTNLVCTITVSKYKESDITKYLIFNRDKVFLSGTEQEIKLILKEWTVL